MFKQLLATLSVLGAIGSATCGYCAADIAVAGGLHLIPNGTGEGRLYGSTLLPDVTVNNSRQMKLVVYNQGDSDLVITLPVTLTGFQSTQFSIVQSPPASIPPGGSSPLTISYNPTVVGTAEAVVTINNNDPDENPFFFIIQANAIAVTNYVQPDIDVVQVTPPVQKCNKKGACSLSGSLAVVTTSTAPFIGGLWYVSRLQESGFSGHSSEQIASGVVKKMKVFGGDPNFPAIKVFKYKLKNLTSADGHFALLVVPSGAGYDPDYTNNWVHLDLP